MSRPSEQLLFKAIEKTNAENLQTMLKGLCAESPFVAEAISQRLLVHESAIKTTTSQDVEEPSDEDEDADSFNSDEEGSEESDGEGDERPAKRLKADSGTTFVSRFETCQKCKKQYDVTANDKDICRTHDDFLFAKLDHDTWVDDDNPPDEAFTDLDEHEYIRSIPDAFYWECCEGNALAEGCVVGRHKPLRT